MKKRYLVAVTHWLIVEDTHYHGQQGAERLATACLRADLDTGVSEWRPPMVNSMEFPPTQED
jgi:hypothetical protein